MYDHRPEELISPQKIEIIPGVDPLRDAQVIAEPLERGFGLTLGNAMRRVMLSSLRGAAITSVYCSSIQHEFSSISGVREDVTDIILNLKEVVIRKEAEGPRRLLLRSVGPKEVTARDIKLSAGIEVLNKDHVICHLDEGARIDMELTVENGRGYAAAPQDRPEDAPVGMIYVDAKFSPVRRVAYNVQPTREGQIMDYDKLMLRIETDGSVHPSDAVAQAASIVQSQMNPFVNINEPREVEKVERSDELPFSRNLLKKVEELELSVRSANCLRNDNIVYIGDLVQKSEPEMMRTPNFGRKSLNEIKEVLNALNLTLGMEIQDWPPENIEELARKYEY